jgi:hypothetical protein
VADGAGDAAATVGDEMPVEESFCGLAVADRAPLVIREARREGAGGVSPGHSPCGSLPG